MKVLNIKIPAAKALFLTFWITVLSAHAAAPKPKYGSLATPISRSSEYFRSHPAPDYWAMSPYYVAQMADSTCSVASLTMVLNALRSKTELTSEEELVTEPALLKLTKTERVSKGVLPEKRGVTLEQLKDFADIGLKAYGFKKYQVEIVRVFDDSQKTKQKLLQDFSENEKDSQTQIIANFLQSSLTEDAAVGHVAPIAAFDAIKKKVLIMDPDRKWYEPYWVSVDTLLKGMLEKDSSTQNHRGYIKIKIEQN